MKICSVSQQNLVQNKNHAPSFSQIYVKESFWENGLLLRGGHPVRDEFVKQMKEVAEQNPDIDCILEGHKQKLLSGGHRTYVDVRMHYTQDKVQNFMNSIDKSSKNSVQGKERQTLRNLLSSNTNMSIPTVMESFHQHPSLLTEGLSPKIEDLFSVHRLKYPEKYFEKAPNCDKLATIRSAVNVSQKKAKETESKVSFAIQRRLYDDINRDLASVPDDDKSDFFSEKYFFEAQVIYTNLLKPEEMLDFLGWIDKSIGAELILSIPNGEARFKNAIKQTNVEDQEQWENAFELLRQKP